MVDENKFGSPTEAVGEPPSVSFNKLEIEFNRFPFDVVVVVGVGGEDDTEGGSEVVVLVPLVVVVDGLSTFVVGDGAGLEMLVDSPESSLLLLGGVGSETDVVEDVGSSVVVGDGVSGGVEGAGAGSVEVVGVLTGGSVEEVVGLESSPSPCWPTLFSELPPPPWEPDVGDGEGSFGGSLENGDESPPASEVELLEPGLSKPRASEIEPLESSDCPEIPKVSLARR